MNIVLKKQIKILDYQLYVYNIEGGIFKSYSSVLMGYLFNFTLGNPINLFDDPNFNMSLEYHWKHEINGSLEDLKIKLEKIKQDLLSIDHSKYEGLDQFAYINLFIVPKDNQYQLIVSSDTFDISKLINLE